MTARARKSNQQCMNNGGLGTYILVMSGNFKRHCEHGREHESEH